MNLHPTHKIIDASKIKLYQTCPRKFLYRHLFGWDLDVDNLNLVFGEAWHRAQEKLLIDLRTNGMYTKEGVIAAYEDHFKPYYDEHYGPEMDLANSPKNSGNAMQALMEYVEEYAGDNFEVLETELHGVIPISDDRTLTFRMDGLVRTDKGIVVMEHKTSKMYSDAWASQWATSIQIDIYYLALHAMYGEDAYGITVNGSVFRKKGNMHTRIPIRKTPSMLEDCLQNVHAWLDRHDHDLEVLQQQTVDDQTLISFPKCGESCTKWNRLCEYHPFCTAWTNPLQKADKPPIGFIQDFWNPIEREETPPQVRIDYRSDKPLVERLT